MLGLVTRRLPAGTLPLLMAAVFVAAVAIAVELLRPTAAGAVGFDTAASVLHFERIVAGRHLESFVTATPKPLLTFVDGSLMAVFDDWRVVAWAAIAAFGAAAAGALFLAATTAGLTAGIAAAALLIASTRLISDVAIAYALVWAVLLCALAGIAVTRPRPHPALAGLALAAATLARLEVIAITGAAIVALIVAHLLARRRGPAPDRSWWWIALGLTALPVMCIHDLLLTGDPLFWVTVSAVFSTQAPDSVLSPLGVLTLIGRSLAAERVVAVLAAVGLAWLWRTRRFALAVGVLGSTFGVAALLLLIAIRGTYVSDRYIGAIDLGLRFAAAFGVTAVFGAPSWVIRRAGGSATSRAVQASAAAAAVVVLAAALRPPGFLAADVRAAAHSAQAEVRHVDSVLGVVRCALASLPGGVPMPPPSTSLAPQAPDMVKVLGPGLFRPRLAHDLDISVGAVAGVPTAALDPATFLPAGVIAIHEHLSDRPAAAFSVLEIAGPTMVGNVVLTPLVADEAQGIWVDWIGRPGGPAAPTGCARTG